MHILMPVLGKVVVRRATPTLHPPSVYAPIVTTGKFFGAIDRINLVNYVVDVLYSVSIRT